MSTCYFRPPLTGCRVVAFIGLSSSTPLLTKALHTLGLAAVISHDLWSILSRQTEARSPLEWTPLSVWARVRSSAHARHAHAVSSAPGSRCRGNLPGWCSFTTPLLWLSADSLRRRLIKSGFLIWGLMCLSGLSHWVRAQHCTYIQRHAFLTFTYSLGCVHTLFAI